MDLARRQVSFTYRQETMLKVTLVTGAAGFIGSNVARELCSTGRRIVASDRMRSGRKWRNLADVAIQDLISPEDLTGWLRSEASTVDLIVHMGAVSSTTETDVERIVQNNVRLSLDLWNWCVHASVPLLYASSAATYGDGSSGFADDDRPETLARLRPMNAYGWSKHLVDRRIMMDVTMGRPTPPKWAGLKFFNVYGPGEDHKGEMRSVVNKMIPVVQRGEPVQLFRSYRPSVQDGDQMRDFVYVDDIVAVVAWMSATSFPAGIFNVGSGEARTWNDLARAVFTGFGRDPRIEYVEIPEALRAQYQYFTEAPMSKLRQAGWNGPSTSLEEGVTRYIEHFHGPGS